MSQRPLRDCGGKNARVDILIERALAGRVIDRRCAMDGGSAATGQAHMKAEKVERSRTLVEDGNRSQHGGFIGVDEVERASLDELVGDSLSTRKLVVGVAEDCSTHWRRERGGEVRPSARHRLHATRKCFGDTSGEELWESSELEVLHPVAERGIGGSHIRDVAPGSLYKRGRGRKGP